MLALRPLSVAFGDSSWRTGSPMIMAHTADTLQIDQGAWTGPPTLWQSADRLHGNQADGWSEELARPLTAPLSGTHSRAPVGRGNELTDGIDRR